ncbi:MAG: trigger factor, partial [Nitrospirae bacterium]|nr:trigger factor [Nitrospirota bacterium]
MLQGIEEITPTAKKLKIQIPPDVINEEINRAYNKIRASAKMPGFRSGKVPQAILEKKFAKDVETQVIEKIIPEFFAMAVKEAQIMPVNYPSVEEKIELVKGQPLSFSVIVEVKPEIKSLTYEGIELKEKSFSVEDKEVESTFKALQESRALFQVSEDAVKEDDMAVIDYDAFVDGSMVKELSVKDYPFLINTRQFTGEGERVTAMRELNNALLGKNKGDAFELKINIEDTHPNKAIAGKEVILKVSVTEVKKKVLPALDDEFAKGFGCSDLEELKKKARDDLYKKKKDAITIGYKKELLDALISSHGFDVPPSMIDRELEALTVSARESFSQKGEATVEFDELKQKFEPIARDNVKSVLILEAIGKK